MRTLTNIWHARNLVNNEIVYVKAMIDIDTITLATSPDENGFHKTYESECCQPRNDGPILCLGRLTNIATDTDCYTGFSFSYMCPVSGRIRHMFAHALDENYDNCIYVER